MRIPPFENGARLFHVPALPTLSADVRCPYHPIGSFEAPGAPPNEAMQLIRVMCGAVGAAQLQVSSCNKAMFPLHPGTDSSLAVPTTGNPLVTGSPVAFGNHADHKYVSPCGACSTQAPLAPLTQPPVGVAVNQSKNLTSPTPAFAA